MSSSLARIDAPIPDLQSHIFEATLRHKSAIIRHVGATLILAVSVLFERDPVARRTPQRYFPSFKDIYEYARSMHAESTLICLSTFI